MPFRPRVKLKSTVGLCEPSKPMRMWMVSFGLRRGPQTIFSLIREGLYGSAKWTVLCRYRREGGGLR